jgi:hypothetical protein
MTRVDTFDDPTRVDKLIDFVLSVSDSLLLRFVLELLAPLAIEQKQVLRLPLHNDLTRWLIQIMHPKSHLLVGRLEGILFNLDDLGPRNRHILI